MDKLVYKLLQVKKQHPTLSNDSFESNISSTRLLCLTSPSFSMVGELKRKKLDI